MKLTLDNVVLGYEPSRPLTTPFSLSIEGARVLAVLGPNGAGKTTFLKTVLGFMAPLSGTIAFEGRPVSEWPESELRSRIGYVPQASRRTTAGLSVEEAVVLGRGPAIGLFGRPGRRDWEAVDRALERTGASAFRGRPVEALSGGERQLVLIARALVNEPSLLVLDEPESHLDFANQERILRIIGDLRNEGVGAVYITHYPHYAKELSDAALLIPHAPGRILAGSSERVLTEENLSEVLGCPLAMGELEGRKSVVVRRLRK